MKTYIVIFVSGYQITQDFQYEIVLVTSDLEHAVWLSKNPHNEVTCSYLETWAYGEKIDSDITYFNT